MGLFGGFKAKFSKDSTAKSASKTAKKNEVVCLGYRVYSEFQDPPQYLLPPRSTPKRVPGVKTVPSRVDPNRNGQGPSTSPPIETLIVTNPNAKKSAKKVPALPPRAHALNESEQHQTAKSYEARTIANGNSVDVRIGRSNENLKPAPDETYVIGKTSSFNPTSSSASTNHINRIDVEGKEATKSILKSKSAFELRETSNASDPGDGATVMVNSRKREIRTAPSMEYSSFSGKTTQTTSNDNYAYSTGYSQSSRALGSTSSQAASIFFGGDEEPEIQRPRRINLDEHEGANNRSAEC
ncbi:hypothetical protein HUJ04_010567 [Dendroctonus ponderosae]